MTDTIENTETLDLVIYQHNAGELATNANIILETVKLKLTGYKAENYSESNIQDAKKDKAELNNAAKKLNDARIQLERDHALSIKDGIALINQAVTLIKTASSQIDEVVKQVEDREKAEKKAAILKFFNGLNTDLVTFDKVFTPDMLNKTAKLTESFSVIMAKIATVKDELEIVQQFGDPTVTAFYLSTLNLTAAMKKANELKASREQLAKIEAAKNVPQPVPVYQAPATAHVPVAQPETPAPAPTAKISDTTMYTRLVQVRGTKEQIIALNNWLNENHIEWERVGE